MPIDPRAFATMGANWGQPLGSGAYGLDGSITNIAGYRPPTAGFSVDVPPMVPGAPYAAPAVGDNIDAGGGWNPAGASALTFGGGAAGGGGLMDSFSSWLKGSGALGSFDAKTGIKTDGWGGLAVGAGSALVNAFMGMKQYGLAKDTLAQNKMVFQKNYEAQKTTTNAALEDRQRARVASNAGAYESVGSYMDRNAVR